MGSHTRALRLSVLEMDRQVAISVGKHFVEFYKHGQYVDGVW